VFAPDLLDAPAALQQKDYLCGPFHAARVLRTAGVTEHAGEPVDQDLIARHAGTRLPDHELGPRLPPGASSWRDYRYDLPRADPDEAGTKASALAQTIEEVSARRLECVPLTGSWTAETVERLVGSAAAAEATLLANLRTGHLWGSHPPISALLAHLEGEDPPDPPAPDWDVGHFVELVDLVRGPAGALVLVRDSYPALGWRGRHLQPPGAVAGALNRGDGRGGGVLAVCAPATATALRQLAVELGLKMEIWDN
jgi:hypothetical protein